MPDNIGHPTRFLSMMALIVLTITGCSREGDLGRHSPTLVSRTVTASFTRAREFVGENEDYRLPFTAAEDALRHRYKDLRSIRYGGVVARIDRANSMDGASYIAAITQDLKVETQRFSLFVVAAQKTMQIDEARVQRLTDLDDLTVRQQKPIAAKRRGRNNRLIRNGVRSMRERSDDYRQLLKRLPIEWPHLPLVQVQFAYEEFHEDIVQFHGEIDRQAHMRLGRGSDKSFK